MINFLIYHHSQKYSFTRRPNTQLYMQFACYRKQKIKKFINPQSRQQQNASPSPYHPIDTTSHIPTPQNTEPHIGSASHIPTPQNTEPYRLSPSHPQHRQIQKSTSAQPPTSQHRRIQNPIGSALHIPNTAKYRNPHRHNLPHPNTAEYNHKSTTSRHHNQELLKKSPRGVQRGRGFTAPLRFSFFPKKEYIV